MDHWAKWSSATALVPTIPVSNLSSRAAAALPLAGDRSPWTAWNVSGQSIRQYQTRGHEAEQDLSHSFTPCFFFRRDVLLVWLCQTTIEHHQTQGHVDTCGHMWTHVDNSIQLAAFPKGATVERLETRLSLAPSKLGKDRRRCVSLNQVLAKASLAVGRSRSLLFSMALISAQAWRTRWAVNAARLFQSGVWLHLNTMPANHMQKNAKKRLNSICFIAFFDFLSVCLRLEAENAVVPIDLVVLQLLTNLLTIWWHMDGTGHDVCVCMIHMITYIPKCAYVYYMHHVYVYLNMLHTIHHIGNLNKCLYSPLAPSSSENQPSCHRPATSLLKWKFPQKLNLQRNGMNTAKSGSTIHPIPHRQRYLLCMGILQ